MAEHVRLLPKNATSWMLATAEANDPLVALGEEFSGIRLAYRNTPPQFLPFVVWQYGLGELTPYLPNLYNLIEEGLRWQRVRGTPAAIERGLSWLGYAATLYEDPTRRRKWNRFQIELSRIRDADLPDLRRIDGIVSLSPPARSVFYRGFRDYDVRALELSRNKLSQTLFSSHSGFRIDPGRAKWSFGRSYSGDALLGEPELTALGTWLPTVPEGDLWTDADYPWTDADFPWSYPAAIARRITIANALIEKPVFVLYRAAGGERIGYRRAIIKPVKLSAQGEYLVGAARWGFSPLDPAGVIVQARTGFGDGSGQTAATMEVVFEPTIAPGVSPGALWLSPPQASGGFSVAQTAVSIPFGLTVRELCRITLRF